MTEQSFHVVAGIDTHADAHAAAVLDAQGKPLADDIFPATTGGYRQLTDWLQSFGQLDAVGVEGSGGYGAGLTRYLQARNLHVVEVNRPHPHTRSRRGKTDSIDAEAAARKVQAGECTATPKDTSGIVEAIRQIHLARASAVKARATALAQFGQMVTTAPDPVRDALTAKSVKGKTNQAATFQPDRSQLHDPAQATKLALCSIADRIHSLDTEIAHLDHQLSSLVRQAAPRTLELTGIGTVHAAQMLITAGQNIDRLHSEAAFARLCAAAPIPASSGKTTRHRLNPFGDRDANRTLHLIAVVRLRYCDRTRSYSARRTADGLSKLDVIRCLKRYIAREIYHTIRADLHQLPKPT